MYDDSRIDCSEYHCVGQPARPKIYCSDPAHGRCLLRRANMLFPFTQTITCQALLNLFLLTGPVSPYKHHDAPNYARHESYNKHTERLSKLKAPTGVL